MSTAPRYHQMLVSSQLGGASKLAMEIHRHVVTVRGALSQLLVPAGGEAEARVADRGFPYVPYSLERLTARSTFRTTAENISLYRRAAVRGRDLVHVHAPHVYGAAKLFLLLSRAKTVLHIHLDFAVEELRWALRTPPDLILLCANFMRSSVEQAVDESVPKRPIVRVFPNAVDTQRFFPAERAQAKANLGRPPLKPLLLMAANLSPHKGQETAVRAVAALRDHGHEVDLCLVGQERHADAGYARRLQELCTSLQVTDRVELAGFRDDVPELLRAADFLLLPSTSEGLPLIVLEAQASKTLVLAAPTAGVPEVVTDGQTGYLIAADDHQAYAERIASLLENPARALRITDTAYRQVREQHDMKSYCDRVLSEYDALLAT